MGPRPAVFLDRDGTISEEIGYIADPASYRLLPGAGQAIRLLNERGLPVILVTNQTGPARGLYGEETVQAVMAEMHRQLMLEGARLDGVYYCPHLPDGIVPAYAIECDCRKPRPGMLLHAAVEHGLDLSRSFAVGDKQGDVAAARLAGCRAVLVLSGHGGGQWADRSLWRDMTPDFVAGDLRQAAEWIISSLPRNT